MRASFAQGRCRVCGKIFCCSSHQKDHEIAHHKEYKYLLDKLPIVCSRCHRSIHFVCDLHLSCHPYMRPGLMNGNFSRATQITKFSRKRTLRQFENKNETLVDRITIPNEQRKKLIPAYKFKYIGLEKFLASAQNTSQLLVVGFSQIMMDSKSIVISPQLNVSYKMLAAGVVKSSTPLDEAGKKNSSVIIATPPVLETLANSNETEKNSKKIEKSRYSCSELTESPIIIISSPTKNTPPGIMVNFPKSSSKNGVKNRKVRFELVKTPEIENEVTLYGTPCSTMESFEEFYETDMIDSNGYNSPPTSKLLKIVKRMRMAIHKIPRSIFYVWNWGNQKFKKSKSRDESDEAEIRSPLKKRPRYDTDDFLSRRPISSYWVNMSVNSLFRKPLPNYVQRYHSMENSCD